MQSSIRVRLYTNNTVYKNIRYSKLNFNDIGRILYLNRSSNLSTDCAQNNRLNNVRSSHSVRNFEEKNSGLTSSNLICEQPATIFATSCDAVSVKYLRSLHSSSCSSASFNQEKLQNGTEFYNFSQNHSTNNRFLNTDRSIGNNINVAVDDIYSNFNEAKTFHERKTPSLVPYFEMNSARPFSSSLSIKLGSKEMKQTGIIFLQQRLNHQMSHNYKQNHLFSTNKFQPLQNDLNRTGIKLQQQSALFQSHLCLEPARSRSYFTPSQSRSLSFWSASPSRATDLNKAVTEAEKIVGYSTSFLSLRCLLSDELSNVAMQMRKLIGTTHPLLKTARKLFYNGKQGLQTRGLLVLLISKAGGPSPQPSLNNEFMVSGIYPRQRSLAEITEMIHTSSLIHKGVVNLSIPLNGQPQATPISDIQAQAAAAGVANGTQYRADMEFGNKMAVLSGDFLLANAATGLASLKNTKVVELMSEAIGDLMKAEFTRLRDAEGSCVLPRGGASVEEWEEQTFLSGGSLISHSCHSALLLANHSQELCNSAFQFGKQLSMANQINEELQPLLYGDQQDSKSGTKVNGGVTLSSLPIILYLQAHSGEAFAQALLAGERPSQSKILKELGRHRDSLLDEVRGRRAGYAVSAEQSLAAFKPSSAHKALQNIVSAITHV